ncbi:ATP-binding protein [Pseudonocardia sp. H11422]|uniref:ATP-binding protein n=1 Tax=Pseudonocardia sp. H11422 TaxID=2835866 RepID=UPI001BDDBF4E|nr:ATP-binding protein [Pseudonocardia sp. H11422]
MVRPTTMWKALFDYLPRGNTLDDKDWQLRHRLLEWLLALHIPALAIFGLILRNPLGVVLLAVLPVAAFLVLGHVLGLRRRLASIMITTGLVYATVVLVVFSHGAIEAHFHFFVIVGFIALYQDWVPFLVFASLMVLMRGVVAEFRPDLIFNHPAAQAKPWLWALLHGSAVVAACIGVMLFWRITENQQNEKKALSRELADSEIGRRRFTSDLLLNLARRNQGMVYRQLDIINQLEESEQDPDALSELFRLDHLATRVRRNAESLLVLSGDQPARVWRKPVPLRDVVRAAIAETEDLDRVVFSVDERPAVSGRVVTDLTHLLAELTENAVRFSPPDTAVTIRTRPDRLHEGGQLLTIEDWGVGMPPEERAAADELLARPPEVDLSVAQRLGFHVVARLAARHGIQVTLSATPGSGLTALIVLPPELFESRHAAHSLATPAPAAVSLRTHKPGLGGAHAAELQPARVALREPVGAGRPGNGSRGPQQGGAPAAEGDSTGTDPGLEEWMSSLPEPTQGQHAAPETWPPLPDRAPDAASDPVPDVASGDAQDVASDAVPAAVPDAVPDAAPGSPSDPVTDPAPGVASDRASDPVPDAVADPGPGGTGPADGVQPGAGPTLRRRVPQTHLAPELQAPDPGPADEAAPPPSNTVADALSRYQASRSAARAVVEAEGGES